MTVKVCAPAVVPLMVLAKVISAPAATRPLFVVSKILVGGVPTPLNTTGPLKVWVAPAVMTLPAKVIFEPVTCTVLRATVLPTSPPNDTAPLVPALTVRDCAPAVVPSIVLPKLILPPAGYIPPFVESKVVEPNKVTAPL